MFTDLEKKQSAIEFTAEQIKEIEDLAGMNYTVKQLAMYFDIPYMELQFAYDDPESIFRYSYDRGKLIVSANVDKNTIVSANKGNVTAMQILKKSQKDTIINNLKHELFGIG